MAVQAGPVLPAVAVEAAAAPGYWPAAWRRFRRNRAAVLSGGVILALLVVAVVAPWLAPHGPYEQFLEGGSGAAGPLVERPTGKFEAPSLEHPFGTDELARDIFSRALVGLRISLGAACFAIVLVTAVGVAVGMAAAAGPRWADGLTMRVTDVAYAFPDLLLIILLRASFGDSLLGQPSLLGVDAGVALLFLAISLTAWPTMARLVRGQLLAVRETEYSLAARATGVGPWRMAFRHWLPNASGPVIVEATFLVPRVIFAEAALSFIGVGVSPPTPSLGVLIASHFSFVMVQWTALAIPTLILAVLFVAFQFFGDGLRDALDPRVAR